MVGITTKEPTSMGKGGIVTLERFIDPPRQYLRTLKVLPKESNYS